MASNDEGSGFPEPPEGIVRPDVDSVFGFLDEPDQVQAAMEELVAQGFDRERIYVDEPFALDVPGHGAVVDAAFVRRQRDALAARFGVR